MSSQSPSPLMHAARRLLEDGGPDALTMDALAEAVGLSRATVYRRVGSRELIIEALAAEGVDVTPRPPPREAILLACRAVFSRLGFERATLEDVAAEAGVGVATLYRHFGDRDGLITAFADSIGGRAALRALPQVYSGDVRADLLVLMSGLTAAMMRDQDLVRLGLIELLSGSERLKNTRASTESVHQRVAALLNHYMEQGELRRVDPQQLTMVLIGPVLAVTQMMPLSHPEMIVDIEQFAPFLVDQFLYGARGASSKE